MLLGLPLLAAVTLASQAPDPRSPRHPPDQPPLPPTRATHAAQPPVIDGRDDDGVWRGPSRSPDFKNGGLAKAAHPSSQPKRKSRTTRVPCTCSSAPSMRTPTASSQCSRGATTSRLPT